MTDLRVITPYSAAVVNTTLVLTVTSTTKLCPNFSLKNSDGSLGGGDNGVSNAMVINAII